MAMTVDRFTEKLKAGESFAGSVAERNVLLYHDTDEPAPKWLAGAVDRSPW